MKSVYANSPCTKCIEAFIAGNRVYCGAYGSFRSLHDTMPKCEANNPVYTRQAPNFTGMEAKLERISICERLSNGKYDVK